MKTISILALGSMLTACSASQASLWSGGSFALMEGVGTMNQQPNGKQGFRYAINEKAFNGLPGDPEESRLHMLSQWLGKVQGCPNGYNIDKRSVATETVLYEGTCK